MIGFSFVYQGDQHEVREDIHGLALKASGEWGHVQDGGLPRYDEGFVAGSDLRLGQELIREALIKSPRESSISLHAEGSSQAQIKELRLVSDTGQLQLKRLDGTLFAFVGGGEWWLSGGPQGGDRKLGSVVFLFEGRRLEQQTAPLGPRSRLSVLAARLIPA